MSYTVLARKYRPQRFADVIGQDHVTRTLKNAIEQQRIAHGYIFSGHRGIGKTTIARILAMALNCRSAEHPVSEPCGVCDSCREIREGSVGAMDVIEIDAATNRGIEEVRGLIATATAEPARDRYRIFILDEAHQVTDAAFNALLKTLEEPPPWVIFMMATTQPEDIPQTIRSRCQHFSFHAVRFDDIVGQLRSIAQQENLQVDDDALAMLAEAGDGSMRDALSIMDQAIACCGTSLSAEVVRGLIGTVSSDTLEHVMQAVHENSAEQALRIVDKLIVEGHSVVHFAKQMVRFLRNAIMAKVAGGDSPLLQISSDERARVVRIAELFTEEDLTRFLQIILRTHGDVSYKQEQRFHLELGILKLVHAQRLLPLEQLLSDAALPRPAATARSTGASPQRAAGSAAPGRPAQPATPPRTPFEQERGGSPFGSETRPSRPSPFDADRARKDSGPKGSMSAESSGPFGSTPMTSMPPVNSAPSHSARSIPPRPHSRVDAAPAMMTSGATAVALAVEPVATPEPQLPQPSVNIGAAFDVSVETVRDAVLAALQAAGQNILLSSLEEGDWALEGAEVIVKAAMSQKLIDLALGADLKKQVNAAASKIAGGALKVRVVSGTPTSTGKPLARSKSAAGHGRAADEPLVKRMIEKFGAEVRTVIEDR
ncbi:MAG TPA: DNA polymerase III subunit gamma/tau [Clostridia bacterium]|nr:DNA polymerase III subunit gamma/tau [Clostridia bacterium]